MKIDHSDIEYLTNHPDITQQGNNLFWLRSTFWILAIVLGAIQAWANHHYLQNSDALSYLDMAESFTKGDWPQAVNAYWSPLYPILIALAMIVIKPSPYWEFALLHIVNLLIFFAAFGSFDFLLRQIVPAHLQQQADYEASDRIAFSEFSIAALGYALFLWAALFMVSIQLESPDMLLAAVIFLVMGLITRIWRGESGWGNFIMLGLVLGIGYWAKSPMFILAFVFLGLALLATNNWWRALPRVLLAFLIFIALSSPWIVAISKAKGHLTLGEAGRLNMMWFINGVDNLHGQETGDARGQYSHPTRRIFAQPEAYEFATPVGGTYPVWYEPSYWYEGAQGHFVLKGHLAALFRNAQRLYQIFYTDAWGMLLAGTLILYFIAGPREWLGAVLRSWYLLLPALIGIAMFSILFLEKRYIAPFAVLLFLALWVGVRLPASAMTHRVLNCVAFALVLLTLFSTLVPTFPKAVQSAHSLLRGDDPQAHDQWQVATGLRQMGIQRGDRVASIGNAQRAFWARLCGAKIIAEVPARAASQFWTAGESTKVGLLAAFAATGAKVVVTDKIPEGPIPTGWRQIQATNYYAYDLSKGVH